MSLIYRYPGVKPFEISDAALFFGRERDQIDLLDLVKREKLTVLFGKSGYGKSSLVKAGLIPELLAQTEVIVNPGTGEEENLNNFPVYIRLNLFGKTGKSTLPVEAVLECFQEQVGPEDTEPGIGAFFQNKNIPPTLWTALKSSKTANQQRIFLIFDQFEEFFSYPIEAQVQFRQELSELLYTRIPQSVRDQMADLERPEKRLLHKQLDVHTLFIIRSDRMHLLNSMREDLPTILHARYELNALSQLQAKDAIVQPAQLRGPAFILKEPFEYEPPALAKILSELSKPSGSPFDQEEQYSIEAFQLQMVCLTIEQNLIAQTRKSKTGQPTLVKETDLPDFAKIYEEYYLNKLAELDDNYARETAHILLEEVMVIGDGMSDVRRVSIDKDLLQETMLREHRRKVSQELLDYLEDKFLIRRETIGGRIHYEISHDVLLPPLVKSREEARQKAARALAAAEFREQQAAAEKRAKEAEILAAEERARRQKAVQQRRRARMLAVAALVAFCLAAATGIWAFDQKALAEAQKIEAETAKIRALKALDKQIEAERAKEKQAFELTLTDMETILKSPDGCPDSTQRNQLKRLPPLYPKDQELQNRVKALNALLLEKNCQ